MRGTGTVWLVGMMGAGKSTVGPLLAERLGCGFVDTDAEVERAAGCSIAEIFEREGEAAFRTREREAIGAVAGRAAVVALGGGAVAEPGMRERLAACGTLVYLRARPETLLARVGEGGERPLLGGAAAADRLTLLRELLSERRDAYEAAEVRVDCDELDAERVVAAIARALSEPERMAR